MAVFEGIVKLKFTVYCMHLQEESVESHSLMWDLDEEEGAWFTIFMAAYFLVVWDNISFGLSSKFIRVFIVSASRNSELGRESDGELEVSLLRTTNQWLPFAMTRVESWLRM